MTLADAIRRLNSRPRRAGLPRLWLMTDALRLPDPRATMARLPVGAGVVIRHPHAGPRARMAAQAMHVARRRRLTVLVSEDWRLAARLGAAGVHLPERQVRSGRLAEILGWARRRKALLTMACHSRTALAQAARLGIDAALLSPIFPTASHPGAAGLGPLRFRLLVRRAEVPVLALGGVNPITARRLAGSGAHGLAAIGGLA